MEISSALDAALGKQAQLGKPLAVIVAGHNGSGKSTFWYRSLANRLQIPLVNADRMMLSILPEVTPEHPLPLWASTLRDTDERWMKVAQNGVQAFIAHAMIKKIPFATETVFSHWREHPDGRIESKAELIHSLHRAGYFVLLVFVGLTSAGLSAARVQTRAGLGGHNVDPDRIYLRFPRTQRAIRHASDLADACIFADNSRGVREAFTVCRVQMGTDALYDWRDGADMPPAEVLEWLDIVSPR